MSDSLDAKRILLRVRLALARALTPSPRATSSFSTPIHGRGAGVAETFVWLFNTGWQWRMELREVRPLIAYACTTLWSMPVHPRLEVRTSVRVRH